MGRDVAHACFVVRRRSDDSARAPALLVLDTNTWHAYNTWGGRSLYTGGNTVSHARPFGRGMLWRPEVDRNDRKARPVRWGEEPDVDGAIFQRYRTEHDYPAAIGSAGWFTHARRFVEWAEGAGHRFDYAVSSDLERDPDALAGYDTVLSVGHDEYWSAGQRRAVEDHVRRGGNVASFSGNTMFWQVRLDDSEEDGPGPARPSGCTTASARPRRVASAVSSCTATTTGCWRAPGSGDAEFIATRLYGDAGDTNLARVRHGNAVMLTCRPFGPDGGEVVTVGTTDWVFGLASDPAVMRVTANVLDRFAT